LWELCEGNLEGVSFTGDSERYVEEAETEHLSPYRGFVRGTWRVGSFTGDSKRHVKEGFVNGTSLSLQKLHEGNLKGGLIY
jgi:hypothetical protein